MTVHKIQMGDEGQIASRALVERVVAVAGRVREAAPEWKERLGQLKTQVATLATIDKQYGGLGRLPLEDAGDLVDAILTELARIEGDLERRRIGGPVPELDEVAIGVALWALRHEVAIGAVAPVANALARRSNAAKKPAELAAILGIMHGVARHVAPALAADLDRMNPERPWRILHVNLAVTAIRGEDPALIEAAFDALDAALPEERAGFYAEALALALSPRVAPAVRERIEARHLKWTAPA